MGAGRRAAVVRVHAATGGEPKKAVEWAFFLGKLIGSWG